MRRESSPDELSTVVDHSHKFKGHASSFGQLCFVVGAVSKVEGIAHIHNEELTRHVDDRDPMRPDNGFQLSIELVNLGQKVPDSSGAETYYTWSAWYY